MTNSDPVFSADRVSITVSIVVPVESLSVRISLWEKVCPTLGHNRHFGHGDSFLAAMYRRWQVF
ncbi:MAG TPA: hypothetical protein VFA85_19065 [Terriglobales bacterium]|nr:hypothetical protein [Terriglobales bacterium]